MKKREVCFSLKNSEGHFRATVPTRGNSLLFTRRGFHPIDHNNYSSTICSTYVSANRGGKEKRQACHPSKDTSWKCSHETAEKSGKHCLCCHVLANKWEMSRREKLIVGDKQQQTAGAATCTFPNSVWFRIAASNNNSCLENDTTGSPARLPTQQTDVGSFRFNKNMSLHSVHFPHQMSIN